MIHEASSRPVEAVAVDAARKHRRLPRPLRIALIVLALAYPFYVLVANTLLVTGAIEAIANSGDEVHLEYESATSWFPGHVSVKGFRLRIEDKNLEAYLDLPEADVRIAMFALLRKTFHATRVRGIGARFYLKLRVPTVNDDNVRRLAAYPAIPGSDPIAFSRAGPPVAGEEPESNLDKVWKVQLDDVDTSVDELWFQEYRYRGRAIAKGGFRLEPMQRVRVGPASLAIEPGILTAEPHFVATEFGGRLDVTIREFEVKKEKGAAPLAFVDAKVLLSGKIPDLDVLALYSPNGVAPIKGSKGQFRAEGSLSRGAFDEGTELHVDLTQLAVMKNALTTEGPLSASVRAPARGTLVFGADTARMNVRVGAEADAVASITDATLRATLDVPDVSKSVKLVDGTLHAAADVPKMADLFAGLGIAAVRKGRATLALDAALRGESVNATYSSSIMGVELALGEAMRAVADGKVSGKASGDKQLTDVALTDIRVEAPRFLMRRNEGTSRGSWLDISVPRARVRSGDKPCVSFAGNAVAGDSAALAALVDVGPLRGMVAQAFKGSKAQARVRGGVVGSRTEIEVDSASAGDLKAKGVFVADKGASVGAFLLELAPMHAGLDMQSGGVSVRPFPPTSWYDGRAAALRGPRPCPVAIGK